MTLTKRLQRSAKGSSGTGSGPWPWLQRTTTAALQRADALPSRVQNTWAPVQRPDVKQTPRRDGGGEGCAVQCAGGAQGTATVITAALPHGVVSIPRDSPRSDGIRTDEAAKRADCSGKVQKGTAGCTPLLASGAVLGPCGAAPSSRPRVRHCRTDARGRVGHSVGFTSISSAPKRGGPTPSTRRTRPRVFGSRPAAPPPTATAPWHRPPPP